MPVATSLGRWATSWTLQIPWLRAIYRFALLKKAPAISAGWRTSCAHRCISFKATWKAARRCLPKAEHINAMLEETRCLSRLIDDLRRLSLAESVQLLLIKEAAFVNELLAHVSTSFSRQVDAAGINVCISEKRQSPR